MKTIRVSAAVIRKEGRFFVTQRGYGPYRGCWEFPGGKIESGESPEEALIREIREELEVDIQIEKQAGHVEYDYPEFHLSMTCFFCRIISGSIHLIEHEAARWVKEEELLFQELLPADKIIAEQLRKGI